MPPQKTNPEYNEKETIENNLMTNPIDSTVEDCIKTPRSKPISRRAAKETNI